MHADSTKSVKHSMFRMNQFSELAISTDPALVLEQAGVIPDPWQAKVLRSRSKRQLLCCSRQSGKSLSTAAIALHTALYDSGALVLLLSPSLRQSQELFRVVMRLYERIRSASAPEAESTLKLELANGSRIAALPGGKEETIRGFSDVSLLVLDEAARIGDDLFHAVKPMLAVSNGRMIALSTPFGRRGFFFREWTEGDGWERTRITANECPRISAEFLESERRSMPASWFASEYMCEFVESENGVFSHADVMRAVDDSIEPLFDGPLLEGAHGFDLFAEKGAA